MKVRSASLLDLSRIEQIHREAEDRFARVAPPARLWLLVSQTLSALLPLAQETVIEVAEEGGRVVGFIQASGGAGTLSRTAARRTLQVLNLSVAEGTSEREVAPALVTHLCEHASRSGVLRLFVRLPLEDPLLPVFRYEGFRQYATESVLYAEAPVRRVAEEPAGLRTARGRDSRAVYHLYRKVTPPLVAQMEAPAYADWRALRAMHGEQAMILRQEVAAWVGVERRSHGRPHTLSFMALPETGLVDEIADHAIGMVAAEPAWSGVRHYDSDMIDALRGRGFSLLLTQALLVRELAVRATAREKGLVPSFG